METKLIAAEIATSAGVATVITSSKRPESIFHIIEYVLASEKNTTAQSSPDSSGSSTPLDPNPNNPPAPTVSRPPHTLFLPSASPLSDLKSWTSHTLTPAGSVVVDSGAYRVLSRRDSGGRLLAAGVLAVQGSFASGQAVRILVRKHPLGFQSLDVAASLLDSRTPLVSPTITRPSTPKLLPESLSSSISSIDQLSRQASLVSITEGSQRVVVPPTVQELEESSPSNDTDAADSEWEHIEVGRGLANYNSAEIRKVRGCKRSVDSTSDFTQDF
jgi:glutamate 5-kinase